MQTPLPVTQPVLLRLALEYLVERVDQGAESLDELLRAGLDPTLLDQLRYIPVRDLARLAEQTRQSWLSLTFDCQALLDALAKLKAGRKDDELLSYFIINGAPAGLIADLFKLPFDEVRFIRSQLLTDGAPTGRPRLPPPDERPAICNAWARLLQQDNITSTRERIYQLHQRFSAYSIQALWAVINEFGDAVPSLSRKAIR
jgi:hypothetical protein